MKREVADLATLLKAARGEDSKRSVYTKLGVSPQTYEFWESGVYIPGDEHVGALAEHLQIDEREVVWMLYQLRIGKTPIIHALSTRAA